MPRRKVKLDLTLFPFLSVLTGLIAVMVLFMIVTISTRVISSEAVRDVPKGDPYADGEKTDAPTGPREVGVDPAEYRRLEEQIRRQEESLQERLEQQEAARVRLRELAALVNKLKAERAVAAAQPRKGQRLGEPTRVKMIPARGGGGAGKKPVFVEIDSRGYLVHPDKKRFPVVGIKTDGVTQEPEVPADLAKFLTEVAGAGDKYLLLLVRPDGVDTFAGLRLALEKSYPNLGIGWEPFSQEWLPVNE